MDLGLRLELDLGVRVRVRVRGRIRVRVKIEGLVSVHHLRCWCTVSVYKCKTDTDSTGCYINVRSD